MKRQSLGMEQLERDIYVAETLKRIKNNNEKIDALQATLDSRMEEMEIIESHVMVNGQRAVLLTDKETNRSVCIPQRELDHGTVTLKDGYQALADMVGS